MTLQKLMPGAVVDMVANVSRITGACQLLQGDAATQVPSCFPNFVTCRLMHKWSLLLPCAATARGVTKGRMC